MSELALFIALFGGLFVLRLVVATLVFGMLLPRSDRCPICDAPTDRVEAPFSDRFLPWFRKRWCLRCGWTGMLRRGTLSERPATTRAFRPRR